MSDKKLEVGDLVWAKMKSYPFWPSRIVNPPGNIKTPSSKKAQHCVLFFGTEDYAWISDDFIVPHSEEMVLSSCKSSKKISSALQNAIDEIIELSKNTSEDSITTINGETAEEMSPNTSPQISNSAEKKAVKEMVTEKAQKISPMKESSTNESGNNELSKSSSEESITATVNGENENEVLPETSQHSEKNAEKKASKIRKKIDADQKAALKRSKENSTNKSGNKRKCSSPTKTRVTDDYSSLLANVPPDVVYSHMDVEPIDDFLDPQPYNRPAFIERPVSPIFDVMKASDFLKAKEITPTSKKIGFLGLGMIGRGVVKNLLHSGHKVTIWNRNADKCEPFVKAGACKGLTPADVVASCDITFCCVSDSMAVKYLVFENCGILKGFEGCTVGTKGYVEMSSIDAATSLEISKAITNFGGRYLEAPLIGSRQLAEEGSLLSLVAGDRALFNDCYSCFFAFTRNVYYLSSDIGSGCKMNLIQSMLFGTTSAALAEAMALVERCQLSQKSFLEILEMGPLSCPLVLDKGNAMAMRNFATNTALKHQQKDLNLVLKLGNSCLQSTLTTSAANELFKRAKFLDYSDHDVSAVLMGAH